MADPFLTEGKRLIEQKLDWGPSSGWSTQDFEILSDRIMEDTGRLVSATTLKRLWGRVRYSSRPSTHTLDTLALVIGFQNWRDFKQQHSFVQPLHSQKPVTGSAVPDDNKRLFPARIKVSVLVGLCSLLVLAVLWTGLSLTNRGAAISLDATEATFSSRPVATGLPNSVVFEYDVSKVPADSFFIQQSWDNRLRSRISPNRSEFTSLYYYPGFYQAKLIANETVIREHPLYVPSDGWLGLVEQFPIPTYIPDEALSQKPGNLQVDADWLAEYNRHADVASDWISYYLVQDFGAVNSNHFTLESSIKHTSADDQSVCRHSQVVIIAEQGRIVVPFSIPGCISDLYLMAGDVEIDGKVNDLSGFGTNLAQWQTVRCEVTDRTVVLSLNNEVVYQFSYQYDMGTIVGLRYRFQGSGAVRDIKLFDDQHQLVYSDDFETMDEGLAKSL